jgi:hypothetical protein
LYGGRSGGTTGIALFTVAMLAEQKEELKIESHTYLSSSIIF